jgi:tetratricopeptide (TPR) repeat protein
LEDFVEVYPCSLANSEPMESVQLCILFASDSNLQKEGFDEEVTKLVLSTINGDYYKGIIDSKFFKLIFDVPDSSKLTPKEIMDILSTRISDFLQKSENQKQFQLAVMCLGILFFKIFLQQNYTGPPLVDLPNFPISTPDTFDPYVTAELSLNGETINVPTYSQGYLALAKMFLDRSDVTLYPSFFWWKARCALFHNKSLSYKVEPLLITSQESMEKVLEWVLKTDYNNGEMTAMFYVEQGVMFNYYYSDPRAQECFEKAKKATQLTTNLSASLGVRTKFQEHQIAQLVLFATSKDVDDDKGVVPTEVPLEEDTILLVKPKVDQDSETNLRVIDQVIILALCMNIKNNNPKHGLTTEEMMPYIRRVGANPNNWMVHTHHLLVKSRLESESNKTIERSVFQLQVLTEQFYEEKPSVADRMKYLCSLNFPSIYELNKELGNRFLSLGALSSAMQVFEKLKMFEEIIQCLIVVDKNHRAEQLATERLEKNPNDYVMTFLLGMVKNDPILYEASWEKSGKRYSRAKRALGNYYSQQKKFKEAIPHYEQALAINHLYPMTWFTLGCSYMHVGNFEKGIGAFQKVIQQNPEDSDSWSNLGSCYVQLNRPAQAHKTLLEATKLKYDSYKVWENFLLISFEVEQFNDVFNALKRILEISKARFQARWLNMLIKVMKFHLKDNSTNFGERFRATLQELFIDVVEKIPGDPKIWDSYILFYEESKFVGQEGKIMECFWRELRCLKREGWESNKENFPILVNTLGRLSVYVLKEKQNIQDPKEWIKFLTPLELEIESVLRRTEVHCYDLKEYKDLIALAKQIKDHL